MNEDNTNNNNTTETSKGKSGVIIGCLFIIIIAISILGFAIYIINGDDDVYQYKETYSYEDTEKFEQKRDSIAFVTFKEDITNLANEWVKHNGSLPKTEVSQGESLKEQLLFIDDEYYADTTVIDLFIETTSLDKINKGTYGTFILLQEAAQLPTIEDLSLNVFKYDNYVQANYSEKSAIERASGIPYFFLLENIMESSVSGEEISKTHKKLLIVDRYTNTIVAEGKVAYDKDYDHILRNDIKQKIRAL